MSKKISLTFLTAEGRKSSLSLDDPKDNLEKTTVTDAMNAVIDANVFERVAGDGYAAVEAAVVVETKETPLI